MSPGELADALSWVQAGRAAAIQRFPYLDVALSAMIPVPVPGLGTVATDTRWRFYYDPARIRSQPEEHRLDLVISDWVHEVMHHLRDHADRWRELSEPLGGHPTWNVAGDALINHDLADMGLRLLPGDVTFATLPDSVSPEQTTEEIYRTLRDGRWQEPERQHDLSCGSGSGGPRREWEVDDSGTDAGAEDGSVDPARGALIRQLTAEQLAEHIQEAAMGWEQGRLPLGLLRWADKLLNPVIDWRRELRSVVSRALAQVAGRRDYSWSRRPRRRTPGYQLPGMVAAAPPQVAAVLDTSASMSGPVLAACLTDIAGLVRAAGGTGLHVQQFDAAPGPLTIVRSEREVPEIEVVGGGGTDMAAGIELAAALRPRPDVVVTLTDGYTGWPARPPQGAPGARYVALLVGECEAEVVSAVPDWMQVLVAPDLGGERPGSRTEVDGDGLLMGSEGTPERDEDGSGEFGEESL